MLYCCKRLNGLYPNAGIPCYKYLIQTNPDSQFGRRSFPPRVMVI